MRFAITVCLAVALAAGAPVTFGVDKPETSHLVFVTEYIRELAAIEDIRASGEQELKQDPASTFSNMIHSSTLFQLELQSQISRLKGMSLKPPNDYLIPGITGFYEQKIVLWKRMAEIGSGFIAGGKPGIDYQKLAAEVPQIRAQMDYILTSPCFKSLPASLRL